MKYEATITIEKVYFVDIEAPSYTEAKKLAMGITGVDIEEEGELVNYTTDLYDLNPVTERK